MFRGFAGTASSTNLNTQPPLGDNRRTSSMDLLPGFDFRTADSTEAAL